MSVFHLAHAQHDPINILSSSHEVRWRAALPIQHLICLCLFAYLQEGMPICRVGQACSSYCLHAYCISRHCTFP